MLKFLVAMLGLGLGLGIIAVLLSIELRPVDTAPHRPPVAAVVAPLPAAPPPPLNLKAAFIADARGFIERHWKALNEFRPETAEDYAHEARIVTVTFFAGREVELVGEPGRAREKTESSIRSRRGNGERYVFGEPRIRDLGSMAEICARRVSSIYAPVEICYVAHSERGRWQIVSERIVQVAAFEAGGSEKLPLITPRR